MANCYLEIVAVDRPFEFDVDDNGRTVFSINFEVVAVWPNDNLEEDLVKIAQDAGVPLTLGSNTFISATAPIPTGDGPYVFVLAQPGIGTLETHNGNKQERPAAQVLVRGKPFTAARSRAFEMFRALDGVRNLQVA